MLIRGLWEIQIEAIVEFRFVYDDVDVYNKEGMDTLLPRWEKMKKDKHGRNCHKQQKKYPFILSVYGVLCKEAQVLLVTLTQLMAAKMEEPISHVNGWVNGRIKITTVRS